MTEIVPIPKAVIAVALTVLLFPTATLAVFLFHVTSYRKIYDKIYRIAAVFFTVVSGLIVLGILDLFK